uniref:RNA recognition motif domain, nucleotide-binding alpha-beta plait domain protein n=1 Tax=Tanacetum cinerariifolium TaxID=118510 RepID=A0A699H4C3_TANCI|nr:RNA recognition motif domain, nucleotide-binding alpha-beta plait domain protein [Tanacetum cinerariifolium]
MVRQKAILDLALQFDNACTAKDDLRKAYKKCNNIPQKSSALIDDFLKEGSDKDYDLNLSMYENTAKIEKQMNAKLAWLVENTTTAHKSIYVAKMLKEKVFILDSDEALMSTQEYIKKVIEDVGGDDILRVEKLDEVVAIIKYCSPNNIDDLNVTIKDLSVTYTSVYFDYEPLRFQWESDDEPEAPKETPQFLEHPPSTDYVSSPEHPHSPDYVPM